MLTILGIVRSGHGSRLRLSRTWQVGVALMAAATLWVSAAGSAWALDLMVDSAIDSADPMFQECNPDPRIFDCSLRGAIRRANLVDGPHTITLPAGTYTISTLATKGAGEDNDLKGDLDIAQTITINGAGTDSTVITSDESVPLAERDRIFHVLPAGNLTVRDVSIRRGGNGTEEGGGVLNEGPLTLERVSVRLNEQDTGGGLAIHNAAVIRDSLIFSNQAYTGAGIYIQGSTSSPFTVSIQNTTISSNQTYAQSGAGGGIWFYSPSSGTAVTLNNVTVAENGASVKGGGVGTFGFASLNLSNTIVAKNSAPVGSSPNCAGSIQSLGHNLLFGSLILPESCGFSTSKGDIINTGDPMLIGVQGNGGPTGTYALNEGSPALDAGDPGIPGSGGTACEAHDQRGQPRPKDGNADGIPRCDIGAYEAPLFISPLNATHLAFTTQPGGAQTGSPLSPQPVVRAEDVNGALVASFSAPISLTFGANPGGATLGGTTTVTAVNGVATFTDLSANAAGVGDTLIAASAGLGLTSATSAPFTITAPPPPAFCAPRPDVRVVSTVAGPGLLSATLTAQTSAATPSNSLSSVRITAITNADVRLNGTPVSLGQTVSLPAGTLQATLLLDRHAPAQNPSLASTVAFAVVDTCGEWKSFVGGGPRAF